MKLQLVAPRTGVRWMREGLVAFRREPMAFISLFMLFMTASVVLAQVPLVGGLLIAMLGPAMTLAIMAATEQLVRGAVPAEARGLRRPLAAALFLAALRALRESARPLVVLGLLYALVVWALSALTTLLVGDPFADAFGADGTPRLAALQSPRMLGAQLLYVVFYAPAALAFWHAPALVHWHRIPPAKSLFFSVVTCWRNMGAMTLFGLAWIVLGVLTMLALSVVGALLTAVAGPVLGVALMAGGAFVLSAAFMASTWFSFRDSFQAD